MITQALAHTHYLIEEGYFTRITALLNERLRLGHDVNTLIQKQDVNAIAANFAAEHEIDFMIAEGSLPVARQGNQQIALIPVIGPLMKYDGLCNPGMQSYGRMIAMANADPNISGMVLIMDTPGGTVDGTNELALAVKNSKKPVGVFGDQMVASAGMWIASQAAVIVGNKNNPTAFGSIGALAVKEDISNVVEANRTSKKEIIRAPQSTEKALVNSVEPLTDSTREMIKEDLRGIVDQFISVVKEGRGDKLDATAEGLFKGRMFDAQQARQIGLIDHVGTLSTAINKVADLSKVKPHNHAAISQAQSQNMKFPKLSNLFSGEAWAKVAAAFTEEEQATLEATEQKVADNEAQLATLAEENSALKASVTELQTANQALSDAVKGLDETVNVIKAENETLTAERDALVASEASLKEQLAKKPTGTLTTVVPNPDKEAAVPGEEVVNKKSYRTKADDEVDKYMNAGIPNLK